MSDLSSIDSLLDKVKQDIRQLRRGKQAGHYRPHKLVMLLAVIELAERVAPGLRRNAEVVEVSTPLTNTRYAGALGGSIYGFDHNWTLVLPSGKSFYLGQDVKFCSRVLGMSPRYITEQIGSNDLRQEKTRRKLAQFIIESLNLDTKQLKALQPWELCCQ